jgi:glutamine cyclotransferase
LAFRLIFYCAWLLGGFLVAVPMLRYEVLRQISHEGPVFTQGLVFDGEQLYESAGLYGKSLVREISPESGKVLKLARLDAKVFAEGLAVLNGQLFQLSWQEEKVFVYETKELRLVKTLTYDGEGWGLAEHGGQLLLSDGTSILKCLNPESFAVVSKLRVTLEGEPLRQLNELEDTPMGLLANVWHESFVALIDLSSGRVKAIVDFADLVRQSKAPHSEAVLNGLAYRVKSDTYFVTGKDWPTLYEVKLSVANQVR